MSLRYVERRVAMCLIALGWRSNSNGVMADREAGGAASEPGRQSAARQAVSPGILNPINYQREGINSRVKIGPSPLGDEQGAHNAGVVGR